MKFAGALITAFIGASGPVVQPPSVDIVPDGVSQLVVESRTPPATSQSVSSALRDGVLQWVGVPPALAADASPPTQDEIKLLREAFSTFYGVERNLEKSEQLLSKVIDAWQRQPPGKSTAIRCPF